MAAYDIGSKVLGGWTIVKLLGEGGFGKVYEVEKSGYGLSVKSALKVVRIPPSQSMVVSALSEGMDEASVAHYFEGLVDDFMNEIALLSSLGHPGVVIYHDHEVVKLEQGIEWDILLRMELLECLTDRILKAPLTRDEIIRLGIEISDVLAYCHSRHIIHRDVKPENVFVDEEGRFKLGDFGVSRIVAGTSGALSQKGTVGYMAPELFRGEKYDSSVDVYALGLMLYRFLNGNRLPFLPPAPQPITFADRSAAEGKRLSGEPLPKPEGCDERLFSLVSRACAFDPSERCGAVFLRDALREISESKENGGSTVYEQLVSNGSLSSMEGKTISAEPFLESGSLISSTQEGDDAPANGASVKQGSNVLGQFETVGVWDLFGDARTPRDDGTGKEEGGVPESQGGGSFRTIDDCIKISEAVFDEIPNQVFLGSPVCPIVSISHEGRRLSEGVDYTVLFSDNDRPGRAKVQVDGRGRYKGQKTLHFTIEALLQQTDLDDIVRHEPPVELTPGRADAVARDFLENHRGLLSKSIRYLGSTTFSIDTASGKSQRIIETARRSVCSEPSDRVYFFSTGGSIFFQTGLSGVAVCLSGIYERNTAFDSWEKMTWHELSASVSPTSIQFDGSWIRIGGKLMSSSLGTLPIVMRDALLHPRGSFQDVTKAESPSASVGKEETARKHACDFLDAFVRNPPKVFSRRTQSSDARVNPMIGMSLLGHHGKRTERHIRSLLHIPDYETIYVLLNFAYDPIKQTSSKGFEPALALTERGMYVSIEDSDRYHIRIIPWDEFAKTMERDLVVNTRPSIGLDDISFSIGSTLFAVGAYEGSPWKQLFDGLFEELRG